MNNILAIVKRAYIVLTLLAMLFLVLATMDNHEYRLSILLTAFLGIPLASYTLYRTVRYIFYGK